ncbi:hypothetical protein QBC47DRAFT_401452 [Echria macrotheca]|uniref:F-box domain-containing protein n=1 Tax=Echria macrotheca TaxID=438768 RepID=A0AAJ0BE03_9PEZI|nr:hypothetical protein QBC47DRAFT_401452 [Echria macrotheca]
MFPTTIAETRSFNGVGSGVSIDNHTRHPHSSVHSSNVTGQKAAPVDRLPVEIFEMIRDFIANDPYPNENLMNLAALAQTCKRFYILVIATLYRQAVTFQPRLLNWAAHVGNMRTVERMLEAGAYVNQESYYLGRKLLQLGSDNETKEQRVKKLRALHWHPGPLPAGVRGPSPDPPWHMWGRDLQPPYSEGGTALYLAVVHRHLGIVKLLLDSGASTQPKSLRLSIKDLVAGMFEMPGVLYGWRQDAIDRLVPSKGPRHYILGDAEWGLPQTSP